MQTIFQALILLFCLSCSNFQFLNLFYPPLSHLSLEEKVGQLLMVHFHGEVANQEAKILIEDLHVGGIIYYNWANGLYSKSQVKELSEGLQRLAKKTTSAIPLLIAADHEGGKVVRVNGLTPVLGNQAIGMTLDPFLAESSAYILGKELKAVGVNMNLAPVADVNNNPNNQVIGSRSFGSSPELVTIFVERALQGYRRAGIIACLKHFPGHGDVEGDSHQEVLTVNKSRKELEQGELYPFIYLASKAPAIMTAHLFVPALDHRCCSTLSKPTLDLLRHEAHYDGVIISDSLVMKGVLTESTTLEEVAIQALEAGCDILLLGGMLLIDSDHKKELTVDAVKSVHQSLVAAVKSGRLSLERINESVERILRLKAKMS